MRFRVPALPSSAITPERVYLNRREFFVSAAAVLGTQARRGRYDTTDTPTPYGYATTYNNYYEFGTGKDEPARNAGRFRTNPWTVAVEGLVRKPTTYNLEDLIKGLATEDRVYRMRCVEGWSMVIPWRGFPLADLVRRLDPLPSARYIEFRTLQDPAQMPGQRNRLLGGGIEWPYVEGLRLDEATHPLTLIATGIYGKPVPNQNGAPWRLVVPWKYGFKGLKAIVRMRFTDKQPTSTWMKEWPEAYGFYANVNPTVEHPNHSQAREQPIGAAWNPLAAEPRKPTLMFNGYAEHVGSLYGGMDLRRNY